MCHCPPALVRFLAISVPLLLVMVFCLPVLEIIAYAEVVSWAAVAAWWKVKSFWSHLFYPSLVLSLELIFCTTACILRRVWRGCPQTMTSSINTVRLIKLCMSWTVYCSHVVTIGLAIPRSRLLIQRERLPLLFSSLPVRSFCPSSAESFGGSLFVHFTSLTPPPCAWGSDSLPVELRPLDGTSPRKCAKLPCLCSSSKSAVIGIYWNQICLQVWAICLGPSIVQFTSQK